jgi:uncharacterized protein
MINELSGADKGRPRARLLHADPLGLDLVSRWAPRTTAAYVLSSTVTGGGDLGGLPVLSALGWRGGQGELIRLKNVEDTQSSASSNGQWQHGGVTETTLSWDVVPVDKPDDANVVIGQAHFIKTVDDLHEALVGVSPSLRFGVAFCEASGPRLIRCSGNDAELVDLATRNASAIAAGHSFVILLRDGFPLNVLNPVKAVPEVCTIFCATANPVDILVAVTPRGRGIVGVVDGEPPLGVEADADVTNRRALLRAIGYKL